MSISFREFVNTDPPLIAEIWRKQRRFRGLVDRISHQMVDDSILSRPYFERAGLILAFDDGDPIGFVQTGFCANANRSDWDTNAGVIAQVRVEERVDTARIADELLQMGIRYLVERGASIVYGGGRFPFAPYFQGLYGGSRIPGVLDDDSLMKYVFERAQFVHTENVLIFQRRLSGFRTAVDRQLMSVRRQFQVTADSDPKFADWWEACTLGSSVRTRFELVDRRTESPAASVTFWDIQPLASCWGVQAMGLYDLQVSEEHRRCGLATFLVGEALRHLSQENVGLVEAQCLESDHAVCGVFTKHGFELVGKGHLFEKQLH